MLKRSLIPTALAALALAGCGSATHKTPQGTGAGFYDMSTLAQSFTAQYNTGDWSTGAWHVSDVSCFLAATQTAVCHGDAQDQAGEGPQGLSVTVKISTDGQQWISQ